MVKTTCTVILPVFGMFYIQFLFIRIHKKTLFVSSKTRPFVHLSIIDAIILLLSSDDNMARSEKFYLLCIEDEKDILWTKGHNNAL